VCCRPDPRLLKIALPDDAIGCAKKPTDRSLLAGGLIEPLPGPKR
jgi:hypothetical protein